MSSLRSASQGLDSFGPTLTACPSISEWTAAVVAFGGALDTSQPAFTVSNLCRSAAPEVQQGGLCREAKQASPLDPGY